jgi:hypothetical protein
MVMSAAYPPLLSAPQPGAIPCFRLPELDLDALLQRSSWWDERSAAISFIDTVVASLPAAVTPVEAQPSSLPLFDTRLARKPRVKWTPRCTQVLVANAGDCTNAELVDLIEVETGLRFSLDTVNTRRSLLGLDPPGRNEWTSPLRRWRPWQSGKRS